MKLLITLFGWVPFIGKILKFTYVANCAREALSKAKVDDPDRIKSETAGEYLDEIANDIYDEHISGELASIGINGILANTVKSKAIDIIVKGLKKKYLNS